MKYDITGKVLGVYGDAAFTQPKVIFTYNEKGQRIIKKDLVSNVTTYYVPDAGGRLLAAYNQVGAGTVSQLEVPVYAVGRVGLYRRSTALYVIQILNDEHYPVAAGQGRCFLRQGHFGKQKSVYQQ